jgi:hypothetical protein
MSNGKATLFFNWLTYYLWPTMNDDLMAFAIQALDRWDRTNELLGRIEVAVANLVDVVSELVPDRPPPAGRRFEQASADLRPMYDRLWAGSLPSDDNRDLWPR